MTNITEEKLLVLCPDIYSLLVAIVSLYGTSTTNEEREIIKSKECCRLTETNHNTTCECGAHVTAFLNCLNREEGGWKHQMKQ